MDKEKEEAIEETAKILLKEIIDSQEKKKSEYFHFDRSYDKKAVNMGCLLYTSGILVVFFVIVLIISFLI